MMNIFFFVLIVLFWDIDIMQGDLEDKIRKQIEFYFGDSNLQKDRFMSQKIAENPDGYVDLSVIMSFNKYILFMMEFGCWLIMKY